MQIIDTHTHLYLSQFDEDLNEVVERANIAGVTKFLIPDIDKDHTEKLKQIIKQFPNQMFGMTVHPTSVNADYKEQIEHFDKEIKSGFRGLPLVKSALIYTDKTFIKEQKLFSDI